VIAGLWLSRNLWHRGEQLAAVSTTALIGLMCSPVSWSHHWVWVIPLGVSLLTATNVGRRYPLPTALIWSGLFMIAPIWWPPRGDNQEFDWDFFQVLAGNSYLWLSVVAALLLAFTAPKASRTKHPSRSPWSRRPAGSGHRA
jgi:alpha-1,2-mannosyltransferase